MLHTFTPWCIGDWSGVSFFCVFWGQTVNWQCWRSGCLVISCTRATCGNQCTDETAPGLRTKEERSLKRIYFHFFLTNFAMKKPIVSLSTDERSFNLQGKKRCTEHSCSSVSCAPGRPGPPMCGFCELKAIVGVKTS